MPDTYSFEIVALDDEWRPWAMELLAQEWGGPMIVTRGKVHDAGVLPGFIALHREEPVGLATYRIEGDECELMSLNSLVEGRGIGAALIASVRDVSRAAGCRRLWLITTNDNLAALRFYQKRRFRLAALYPNAIALSRQYKPEIPMTGLEGIPLRDEIEVEELLVGHD
jgi:GNAT superfamily N-acetyltransferase